VGVWSFHRYGDPEKSADTFRLCLRRTMQVATHETGHMFSMMHCIQLECNMNGSNSLYESDHHPLEVCPNCLAKLCFATGAEPVARFKKLSAFCKTNGLDKDAEFYENRGRSCKIGGERKTLISTRRHADHGEKTLATGRSGSPFQPLLISVPPRLREDNSVAQEAV